MERVSQNLIEIRIEVNGHSHTIDTAPTTKLVTILREKLGMTGTKIACEIGRCGACAVLVDGKLVNSCLVMAYQIDKTSIVTIEGLEEEELHPIQRAFLEEGGYQCGYCTPGMVMAVKALLDTNPNPSNEQLAEALTGNLCRCTGYGGIIRSVQTAMSLLNNSN